MYGASVALMLIAEYRKHVTFAWFLSSWLQNKNEAHALQQ